MKNTFGNAVTLTLFGESHGEQIGAVLDGLCPGLAVDESFLRAQMELRRPFGRISTARHERDAVSIVSGVCCGKTTGTPLCILIPNTEQRSEDYAALKNVARPGHADYTAFCKYRGHADMRGGGHFSGRLTAPLVAAGAILLSMLKGKGIVLGTHLLRCAGVSDRAFTPKADELFAVNEKRFAVLDDAAGERMREAIERAANDGDSVGGVLETAVLGVPAGVGEPWFDTVEGLLSHALFSIPAVKGVAFGDGFALADRFGSEANDPFAIENGAVVTTSNRSGGVNGGITNGMPIRFHTAIKPTPSIGKPQRTVDFIKGEPTVLTLTGRHDPAIAHRARVAVDSITALVLVDLLTVRCGADWFSET